MTIIRPTLRRIAILCVLVSGCGSPSSGPDDQASDTEPQKEHDAALSDAAPMDAQIDPDTTTRPACGDGAVDDGERCDDGNRIDGDGCDANCTTACGNGIQTEDEACDDGNGIDGDGCDSNCTPTTCGNGLQTDGEICDDGNRLDGDGCDANCTLTACGNGVLTEGEVCDDANGIDGDGCDSNCTPTGCGNGIVTAGEACDDGNDIDRDECRMNCALNEVPSIVGIRIQPENEVFVGTRLVCEVQAVDANEDDIELRYRWIIQDEEVALGPEYTVNTEPGHSITCRVIASDWSGTSEAESAAVIVENRCGDGYALEEDMCDDGNRIDGDGCDTNCTLTACGNGIQTEGEFCDDGNVLSGDGCDADCSLTACGNGIQTDGEECDDGNGVHNDDCTNQCTRARCGDGVVHRHVEACDTGVLGHAGCDEQCQIMVRWTCEGEAPSLCSTLCGNGQLDAYEECDPAAAPEGTCSAQCLLVTQCGNGHLEAGEACDDGNRLERDGCSSECALDEMGLDCAERDPESWTLDINGQQGSLGHDDGLVYWVSEGRLIQRLDPMTLDRTHRYFGETLQGGIYWAWAIDGQLIIHVAAVNDGLGVDGESLWQVPASDFVYADPPFFILPASSMVGLITTVSNNSGGDSWSSPAARMCKM